MSAPENQLRPDLRSLYPAWCKMVVLIFDALCTRSLSEHMLLYALLNVELANRRAQILTWSDWTRFNCKCLILARKLMAGMLRL